MFPCELTPLGMMCSLPIDDRWIRYILFGPLKEGNQLSATELAPQEEFKFEIRFKGKKRKKSFLKLKTGYLVDGGTRWGAKIKLYIEYL